MINIRFVCIMQIDTGFRNWKEGVTKVRKHKERDQHTAAHSALYVLLVQSKDIHKLLDSGHVSKKSGNRKSLLTILQNVRFLGR